MEYDGLKQYFAKKSTGVLNRDRGCVKDEDVRMMLEGPDSLAGWTLDLEMQGPTHC